MLDIWIVISIFAKFLLYLSVLGASGTVMIALVYREYISSVSNKMNAFAKKMAFIALLSTVVIFMAGASALTGGAAGMLDTNILGLLWGTSNGDALLTRILGIMLILIGLYLPPNKTWVSNIGGLIALWSFTRIGHIHVQDLFCLRLLLLFHLLGIAFWVGVLAPLNWLCAENTQNATAAKLGHAFGVAATFIVPYLLVAGITMAWVLLGDLQTLFSTPYGYMLLIKITLTGALVTAAVLNKQRHIPALRQGKNYAALRLRRAIRFEWVMISGILAVTAVLTGLMSL